MFKLKIVQFKDGSFAIRQRCILDYEYLDCKTNYWWPELYIQNCKWTSLDGAVNRLNKYLESRKRKPDYGKPIKYKKWNDFS